MLFSDITAMEFVKSVHCDTSCGIFKTFSYEKGDHMIGKHSKFCLEKKVNAVKVKSYEYIDELCRIKSAYTFVSKWSGYTKINFRLNSECVIKEKTSLNKIKKQKKSKKMPSRQSEIKNMRLLDSIKINHNNIQELQMKIKEKAKKNLGRAIYQSLENNIDTNLNEGKKDTVNETENNMDTALIKRFGPFKFISSVLKEERKEDSKALSPKYKKGTFHGKTVYDPRVMRGIYARAVSVFNTRLTLVRNNKKVFHEPAMRTPIESIQKRAKANNIGLVGIEVNPGPAFDSVKAPFLNEMDPYLEDYDAISSDSLSSKQLRAYLGDERYSSYESDLKFIFKPITEWILKGNRSEEEIKSMKSKLSIEIRRITFKFQRPSIEKLMLELKDCKDDIYKGMKKRTSVTKKAGYLLQSVDLICSRLNVYLSDEERIDFYSYTIHEFFTDYILTMDLEEIERTLFESAVTTLPKFLAKTIVHHMKSEISQIRIRHERELQLRYDSTIPEQRLMYYTRIAIQEAVKRTLREEEAFSESSSSFSTSSFSELDYESRVNDINYDSHNLLFNPTYLNRNSYNGIVRDNLIGVESFSTVSEAVHSFKIWYEKELHSLSEALSLEIRTSLIESIWYNGIKKISSEMKNDISVEEILCISVEIAKLKLFASSDYEFSFIKILIDMIPEDCYIPEPRQFELKRVYIHSLNTDKCLLQSYIESLESFEVNQEVDEDEVLDTNSLISEKYAIITEEEKIENELSSDRNLMKKFDNDELKSIYQLMKSSIIRRLKNENFVDSMRITSTLIFFIIDLSIGGSITTATSLVALSMLVMKILSRNELTKPSDEINRIIKTKISTPEFFDKTLQFNEVVKLILQLSNGDFFSAIITSGSIVWSCRESVKSVTTSFSFIMEHLTRVSSTFKKPQMRKLMIKDGFRIFKNEFRQKKKRISDLSFDMLFYIFDFLNKTELVRMSQVSYYVNEAFRLYIPTRYALLKISLHSISSINSQIRFRRTPVSDPIRSVVDRAISEVKTISVANNNTLNRIKEEFNKRLKDSNNERTRDELVRAYYVNRKEVEKPAEFAFALKLFLSNSRWRNKYDLEVINDFINRSIFFAFIDDYTQKELDKMTENEDNENETLIKVEIPVKSEKNLLKSSQRKLLTLLENEFSPVVSPVLKQEDSLVASPASRQEDSKDTERVAEISSEKDIDEVSLGYEAPTPPLSIFNVPLNDEPKKIFNNQSEENIKINSKSITDDERIVQNDDEIQLQSEVGSPIMFPTTFSDASQNSFAEHVLAENVHITGYKKEDYSEVNHLYREDMDFMLSYEGQLDSYYMRDLKKDGLKFVRPSDHDIKDCDCVFIPISSEGNLCAVHLARKLLMISGILRSTEELIEEFNLRAVVLSNQIEDETGLKIELAQDNFFNLETLISILNSYEFTDYEISYEMKKHTNKVFCIVCHDAHFDLLVQKQFPHNCRLFFSMGPYNDIGDTIKEIVKQATTGIKTQYDFDDSDNDSYNNAPTPALSFLNEDISHNVAKEAEIDDDHKSEEIEKIPVKLELSIRTFKSYSFEDVMKLGSKDEINALKYRVHSVKDPLNGSIKELRSYSRETVYSTIEKFRGVPFRTMNKADLDQGPCYNALFSSSRVPDFIHVRTDYDPHVSLTPFKDSSLMNTYFVKKILVKNYIFNSWFERDFTPSDLGSQFEQQKTYNLDDFEKEIYSVETEETFEALRDRLLVLKNQSYSYSMYSSIALKWLYVMENVKDLDYEDSLFGYLRDRESTLSSFNFEMEIKIATIILSQLGLDEAVRMIEGFLKPHDEVFEPVQVLIDTNVFIAIPRIESINLPVLIVLPKTILNELLRLFVSNEISHAPIENLIEILKYNEFVLVQDIEKEGDDSLLKLNNGEINLCSFDKELNKKWFGTIIEPGTLFKEVVNRRSLHKSYSFLEQFGSFLEWSNGSFYSEIPNVFFNTVTSRSEEARLPFFNNLDFVGSKSNIKIDWELFETPRFDSSVKESQKFQNLDFESMINQFKEYDKNEKKNWESFQSKPDWRNLIKTAISKAQNDAFMNIIRSGKEFNNAAKMNSSIKRSNMDYCYPVNDLAVIQFEKNSNAHLTEFIGDLGPLLELDSINIRRKKKIEKSFFRHLMKSSNDILNLKYEPDYDKSSTYDLKICDLGGDYNWSIKLELSTIDPVMSDLFSNLKDILKTEVYHDGGLMRFCDLHRHLIFDCIHNYKFKNLFVNHNNFGNMGYIINPGKPAREVSSRRSFRYFFIVEKKNTSFFSYFKPEIIAYKGSYSLLISKLVTLDLETIVWRSNVYHNTFPLRLISNSRESAENVLKYSWCLMFPSKTIRKISAFFKYYNIVSVSTLSRKSNLVKKYFQTKVKRKSESWLIERIIEVLEKENEGQVSDIFGISKSLDERLIINNFYGFPRSRTTSNFHNYNEFFSDILNNFKIRSSHVLSNAFTDRFSHLKHINVPVIRESVSEYKHTVFKGTLTEQIVDFLESEFDPFFSSTTNGCDPLTMKKKKNLIIHKNMIALFCYEKGSTKFELFEYLSWGLSKAKLRGCFSFVSEKVQKDAADREIYVQDYFCKLCHYPIQTVYKKLCSDWPEELVSKSEKYKLNMISKMPFSKSSFYVNLDMKKWSPQDVREKFHLVTYFLYEEDIIDKEVYNLLRLCHDLTTEITLLFDQRIKKNFNIPIDSKFYPASKYTIKTDMRVDNTPARSEFCEVKMEFGWPQGLNHFISTFVHGLASIAVRKYVPILTKIPSDIYYLFHSDDGNCSVTTDHELSVSEKISFLNSLSFILLGFSLALSDTKVSLTDGKNALDDVKSGSKPNSNRLISELVSIYNIEGTIVNPWLRQSANIYSTLVSQDFRDNHLDLISRCVQLFNLSNNASISEAIYSYYLKVLEIRHDRREEYRAPIQFGGKKQSPIFRLAKYGFYYDNAVNIISGLNTEKFFETILKVNRRIDSKTKTKLEHENIMMLDQLSEIKENKNDLINVLIHRSNSINSGLFLPKFSVDLFSTMFENKGQIYSISLFAKTVDKKRISYKEYLDIIVSLSDKKPTELSLGSQLIKDDVLDDISELIHQKWVFNENKNKISGTIVSNELSGIRDIQSEFDEIISFVKNNEVYRENPVLNSKYNSFNSDYLNFTSKFRVRSLNQLETLKDLWNLEKRTNIRSGFSMLYKNKYILDDIKSDKPIHKSQIEFETMFDRMRFKPTLLNRSRLIKNTISSIVNQLIIGRKDLKQVINDVRHVTKSFSSIDLANYMDSEAPIPDKILFSFVTRLEITLKNKSYYIHTEDEEDTSFVLTDYKGLRRFFICKGSTLYSETEIEKEIRSMIRRDVRFVRKIVIGDEHSAEAKSSVDTIDFPEGTVVELTCDDIKRQEKLIGKRWIYRIVGDKSRQKKSRLSVSQIDKRHCMTKFYFDINSYVINIKKSNNEIHVKETKIFGDSDRSFKPHVPGIIVESKINLLKFIDLYKRIPKKFFEPQICDNHNFSVCPYHLSKREEPSICSMIGIPNKSYVIRMKNTSIYRDFINNKMDLESIKQTRMKLSSLELRKKSITDINEKMEDYETLKNMFMALDDFATVSFNMENEAKNIFDLYDISSEEYDLFTVYQFSRTDPENLIVTVNEQEKSVSVRAQDIYQTIEYNDRLSKYAIKMSFAENNQKLYNFIMNGPLSNFVRKKNLAKKDSAQFHLYKMIKENRTKINNRLLNEIVEQLLKIIPVKNVNINSTVHEKREFVQTFYASSALWSRALKIDDFWDDIKDRKFIFIDEVNNFIAVALPSNSVSSFVDTINEIDETLLPKQVSTRSSNFFGYMDEEYINRPEHVERAKLLMSGISVEDEDEINEMEKNEKLKERIIEFESERITLDSPEKIFEFLKKHKSYLKFSGPELVLIEREMKNIPNIRNNVSLDENQIQVRKYLEEKTEYNSFIWYCLIDVKLTSKEIKHIEEAISNYGRVPQITQKKDTMNQEYTFITGYRRMQDLTLLNSIETEDFYMNFDKKTIKHVLISILHSDIRRELKNSMTIALYNIPSTKIELYKECLKEVENMTKDDLLNYFMKRDMES